MNDNFFESLKQALTGTADVVSRKTEDVVETQKLRSKIYNAKKNVEVDYKKLGTIIYQRYLTGEVEDEELVAICEGIRDLLEELEGYQEELAEKKGLLICGTCNATNPKAADFCMKCGTKLPVRNVEETVSEPVVVEFVDEDEFDKEEE